MIKVYINNEMASSHTQLADARAQAQSFLSWGMATEEMLRIGEEGAEFPLKESQPQEQETEI